MGKIEDEINGMGFKSFMEKAMTVALAGDDKIVFKALCTHVHAFRTFVMSPNTSNWESLLYHMEYHNLFNPEMFKKCYDHALTYILEVVKGKSRIGFKPTPEA